MTNPEWIAPTDLDAECLTLCQALNQLPGIRTTESCCGHGRQPYRIWITGSLDDLPLVAWCLDGCHSGQYGWRIIAYTDCSGDFLRFMIEGPVSGYAASEKIAELMRRDT